MKQVKFQPVKGTRDFYPEEASFRKVLFGKLREVAESYGYQEYEGPIIEPLSLYAAKSGEELVKKQVFSFKDRGGEEIALRPEMTPTLARMVAQKQGELTYPLRWFAIGPRFRYEQPQRGRTREFYQCDVDLIGSITVESDAEILAIAAGFLKKLGLTPQEVKIKINDRSLLENKLSLIEVSKKLIPSVIGAIDKKEKMEQKEWEDYLGEIGLNRLQIEDLNKILKDKDFSQESERLVLLFSLLADSGLKDYFEFNPAVVRGLDYYTGIVFEAWAASPGIKRALLGGGRYDNLVEIVGGEKVSGVGFATSDVVLEMALAEYGKTLAVPSSATKVLATNFCEATFRNSLQLAGELRNKGINTELYLEPDKLDKQLKYADRKKIPLVVILGPEEVAKGEVTIKKMANGEQKSVPREKILEIIRSLSG